LWPPPPPSPQVIYGFTAINLVKYLVLVPFVYDYKLGRSLVAVAFTFYAVYNIGYGLVIAGVVSW
jgi:hypothetical protein